MAGPADLSGSLPAPGILWFPAFPSWGGPWGRAGKPVFEQEGKKRSQISTLGFPVSFQECTSVIAAAISCAACGVWELAVNEGPLCALGPKIIWSYWRMKAVGGLGWRTLFLASVLCFVGSKVPVSTNDRGLKPRINRVCFLHVLSVFCCGLPSYFRY